MSHYLIFCPIETTWSMLPETFSTSLKKRWPDAEVRPNDNPEIPLHWCLPSADMDIFGSFHLDGITVGLYGSFEVFALYACWYRTLIPSEIPLILTDQGYHEVYPLTPETTPDDITSERIVIRPPPDPEEFFTRTR